jgi:acetyl-CoA C-acetyltransferase
VTQKVQLGRCSRHSDVRKVAIISSQTGKFAKDSNLSLFELACQPCIDILKSSKLNKNNIDGVVFSSCSAEQYSSSILCEYLGIKPKISYHIDNLCNSGTNAVVSAFCYISSGLCDSVLVVGAEKANSPGNRLIWDIARGTFSYPVHWAALFAKAHMRRYGTTEEQMAAISVKNHMNAEKNPNALFDKAVTLEDVMRSRSIVTPLKLLDCSVSCEGSSAVLLLAEDKAKKLTESPVWIKGIGQQTNCASFSNITDDLCGIESAKIAARAAYAMAKVTPSQVDVVELHDAFTILEILAYEDLGFVAKGEGGKFVNQKEIAINPRGGILGCGHPVGATGVAQTAEIAAQLSGRADKRQIGRCDIGLVHNLAAAGTSSTVMVLGV